MRQQEDIFTDVALAQRRAQFRMRRLQVFNWGTFSNLHDIAIMDDGFLIIGRSGSGKSTLLDAIAALLVPPQWLSFNAAAREGERGRLDRNWATYVRGAWADQKDIDSGDIATRYLRTGSTWSALALTIANGEGRVVTLIQLHWLRGTGAANADVRRHYMIAERSFDIATELNDFDMDIRALKRRLNDVDHYDKFRPYGERFRRLLGIESEMALKLLHKTQSAKNLGDLNGFLREFMLDIPGTFKAAERLVAEFAELDAAHQEVVTARRQIETLAPARRDHEHLQDVLAGISEREMLRAGIDRYAYEIRVSLLEREIDDLQTRDQGLEGEEQQCRERLEWLQEKLRALEDEHRERGGADIETLQQRISEAENQRGERLTRRRQAEEACRKLQWDLPVTAAGFAERQAEARVVVEGWQAADDATESRRDALRDERQAIEHEFVGVRREIEAMQRQPSNIPAHMLDLRRGIADAVGCSEAELPFAGELMQVRPDAAEWRGAIERVLHGFALSMLVDERRYGTVSQYVNDHHLGRRLVYYRVTDVAPPNLHELRPHSLVRKLELKESTFRVWLEAQLQDRFDYACTENMRDFRHEQRALTREGQVRHGPDRHEKDDRRPIDDRSHWVLGFDNREKLFLYEERAREFGGRIAELERQIDSVKTERAEQRRRFEACHVLANLTWQDIDVSVLLDRIAELQTQLQRLRSASPELQALGEQIESQRTVVTEAEQALRDIRVQRDGVAGKLQENGKALEEARQALADLTDVPAQVRDALRQRFDAAGSLALKNLHVRQQFVERAINAELEDLHRELSDLEKAIVRTFDKFKNEWPQAGADMDASLAAAPEFLALLKRLERDGLPRHEQRFFDMLKEQSSENLAALNTRISQARKEIHTRMELVNESLADADFNPGTYLQIGVTDRHLPDVREFREQVQRILSYSWQMDRDEAEARFGTLREVVHRLGGNELEDQHWRERVLDVRQHVEFIGREYDVNDREIEVYRSGAGKSGGQREKLATTCLAAALRYQLGGSDGGLPVYAPVVLDEAFGKADNEFTELGMKIFEKFGFQMIVATPLKSVMTLEPFIGGACFVNISERKHSTLLPIEYDHDQKRLRLPARSDGESVPA